MKRTDTVSLLALERLRFHKSRTLLTGIAIMLTTMLLTAIGTIGVAALDMNRQTYSQADYHAAFDDLTREQLSVLSNHIQVETINATEVFADVISDKTNGVLIYQETVKDERFSGEDNALDEPQPPQGHYPEAEDEICSSPAFFRLFGTEPVIGNQVTLSFRINGKGEILTRDFTISGLLPDVEIDERIDDSRIVWTASLSKALVNEYEEAGLYEPTFTVLMRVHGEEDLSYDEIVDKINSVAADIGRSEESVKVNKQYLYTVTDPGTDVIVTVAAISLIVILFSALVIYSIFYVGVITDVQEIGKLKAIGATRRQIAGMFYRQGFLISAFAVPAGLLIGFLLPWLLFPLVIRAYASSVLNSNAREAADALIGQIHMFSLPWLCLVAAAVLITVWLSLLKPIRMAKKISPTEAIRYQENSVDAKTRRGHRQVKVATLALANLTRNKKRTTVTILTMGLSCVLFICVSAVLSSVSAEDVAKRNIPKGDFRLYLDYAQHDEEYPENNLDSLVQQNYFSDSFLDRLESIDGVKAVERAPGRILSSTGAESAMYEDYENRLPISYFTRDDIAELNACLKQGNIDYDRMTANREIICTHEYSFQEYGLSLGDVLPLTLYDGDREIPLTVTLTAL